MIITDNQGRTVDTGRLTSGGDPTTPHVEMDPRRLAAAVVDSDGPPASSGGFGASRADFSGTTSRAALVDAAVLDRLTQRPYWHNHRTPAPVEAAWAELLPHAERILELGDDMAYLDNLDGQDETAAEEAAYEALSAGKRPPKAKVVDRSAERKSIRAEAAATIRHLRTLRRNYDALVLEHGTTWREELLKDYGSLKPVANAAWGAFRGAYGTWLTRHMVLTEMNAALDQTWAPYRSNQQQRLFDAVTEAFSAIDRLMTENDPNLIGDFVTDPLHIEPPVWQRREWFLSGDPVILRNLATQEEEEGYRLTSFTKGTSPVGTGGA